MKTRNQQRLLMAFAILVFISICSALVLPGYLNLNRYKGWISSKIADAVQGQVHVGDLSWGISHGLWLKTEEFSITDSSELPGDLHFTGIHAKIALLPLLSSIIGIENMKFELKATLSTLAPEFFKPYLKAVPLEDTVGGPIALEVTYTGNLLDHFNVQGSVDLSDATFNGNGLGTDAVILFQADVDPNDIKLGNLNIKVGNNRVSAKCSIRNWAAHPVVQDIILSSNLVLGELLPMVPIVSWKHLDPHGDKIRFVLEGGGQVVIETMTLKEIPLGDPGLDWVKVLSGVGLTARVSDISIPPMDGLPGLELVSGKLRMNQGIIEIEGLQTRTAFASLPMISGTITHLFSEPRIQADFFGELNLHGEPGPEVAIFFRNAGIEKITGTADLDLTMGVKTADPDEFRLNGRADFKNVQLKTSFSPAAIENLNARIQINPDKIDLTGFSTQVSIPGTHAAQGGQFSIKLKGTIEGWQKDPHLLIQDLTSSPIPLNPLVSVIPWDQVDDGAKFVRDTLLNGGHLEINSLSLPKIQLGNPFDSVEKLIAETSAAIRFSDIAAKVLSEYPELDHVSGLARLDKGVLTVSKIQSRMGPVKFPSAIVRASGFIDNLQVSAGFKGPMEIEATEDVQIKKLLRDQGVETLIGGAEVAMDFKYSNNQPKDWTAHGSFMLKGMDVQSHPKGARLDNLQGNLSFSRSGTTEISLEQGSATINSVPVKLSGKITGTDTRDLVAQGKADVKGLDLSGFRGIPDLDDFKLSGIVDLDLDFNLPLANISEMQLDGTLKTRDLGFSLPAYPMQVSATDMEIGLHNSWLQSAKVDTRINDQLLHIEARTASEKESDISLLVKSPSLDIDRLMPGDKNVTESVGTGGITETDSKHILPQWAKNLICDLQVDVDEGKYHNQPFGDFSLTAAYEKGNLVNYSMGINLAKGKILTTGSADFRDLEKIGFVMKPVISNVQIKELAPLFDLEKMPLDGPLSITGHLKGEAGDFETLVSSLEGSIRAEAGPGFIPEVKHLGSLLIDVFSIVNIKGVFSRGLAKKIKHEGVPFEAIKSELDFNNGDLTLNNFILLSDSINANGQGVVDFSNKEIGLQFVLEPIQTINKVLSVIPVLGEYAEKFTNSYVTVQGPLENPDIKVIHVRGFSDTIGGILGIPQAILKDPEELSQEIDAYQKETKDHNRSVLPRTRKSVLP